MTSCVQKMREPTGAYLLDANTLVGLLDPQHVQHRALKRWFLQQGVPHGWATCPSVERVVLAVMTHRDYPGAWPLNQVAARIGQLRSMPGHVVWAEEIDLFGQPSLVLWSELPAPGAVADLALLELASRRGGVLVTLGRRVALRGLVGPSRFRHWLPLEPLLAASCGGKPITAADGARLPVTPNGTGCLRSRATTPFSAFC